MPFIKSLNNDEASVPKPEEEPLSTVAELPGLTYMYPS
jgi:hypothetical protein